jgi:hypothetical protein
MSNELTPEQWSELLSLLSLDCIVPFFGVMAIPIDDEDLFRRNIREVIVTARQMYESRPDQIPPLPRMLFDRLGVTAAERFDRWARNVFLGYHADQPDWSAWDIVFSHWAYGRRRDLDFLPPEKREALVSEYCRNVDTDDVKRTAEALASKPLSDWDIEMFARRNYGASWESSPFSIVEAITRIERLKRFARNIWLNLNDDEREKMQKNAQELVDTLGVWMPGQLPALGRLLEQS